MVDGLHRAQEPLRLALTDFTVIGARRRTISYPVSCERSHHTRPTFPCDFAVSVFSSPLLSPSLSICQNLPTHISPQWRIGSWPWVHKAESTSCTQGNAVWQCSVTELPQWWLIHRIYYLNHLTGGFLIDSEPTQTLTQWLQGWWSFFNHFGSISESMFVWSKTCQILQAEKLL